MKSSLKKGKPVIEMHAPDRRALENAKAVCEFISRNTDSKPIGDMSSDAATLIDGLLQEFPAEPKAEKQGEKAA